jgi:hypothetical protein
VPSGRSGWGKRKGYQVFIRVPCGRWRKEGEVIRIKNTPTINAGVLGCEIG